MADPTDGAGDILGARVANAWHAPALGAVIDDSGRVFRSSVRSALAFTPSLAALPHTDARAGATLFSSPESAPSIARGSVFVGWSGLHNYAHFLLESLPALRALKVAGALEPFPAVSPPLLPWQRALLNLMLGDPKTMPIEIDAPAVRLGEAVFAVSRGLGPDAPTLRSVRDDILRSAAPAAPVEGPRHLYVSRQGATRQALLNEPELETALAARGYAIVRPESLSVRELIALFHHADSIVAPSGAALANMLFCKPGARIIEIQSDEDEAPWSRDLAALTGVDWRSFVGPSAKIRTEGWLAADLRPASAFSWSLEIDAFLAFLDRS
ncbi:DUF563 domain-containing protein [Caulobacter segnis]|uniref:glycosyltransferase family 61 protein n=1 Tax=Caulobacter segnis TaxID=88688 RepID=UPI0026EAAF59|nr:glycosyltransferase 61 family protein [Caulobacter segnis]